MIKFVTICTILALIYFAFSIVSQLDSALVITLNDYTVGKGETLFSLSQKFNVPMETIAQLNDMNTPFNIQTGQILKIPAQ